MNKKQLYKIKTKSLHPFYRLFYNIGEFFDDFALKFHFCPNCGQNISHGKSCLEMEEIENTQKEIRRRNNE